MTSSRSITWCGGDRQGAGGGGPTLIEALTYRLGDHTTADDATRYRDAEVVRARGARADRAAAPLSGARRIWSKEDEEKLRPNALRR